jgi:hypothetical protein
MQYNHALMDNLATIPLVRELQTNDRTEAEPSGPRLRADNQVRRHLRGFSRDRRRQAAKYAGEVHTRALRGRAITLSPASENVTRTRRLRIDTRELSPDEVRGIQERSIKICGMPSLSMALLASIYRAINRLTTERRADARFLSAGIGIDLGLRKSGVPVVGNFMSLVPVWADPDDLDNRDRIVRQLSQQLRQHLASDLDLGLLCLVNAFSRRPRHFGWAAWHALRYSYSLWYAFFGSVDALGERFFDTPIEEVFYTGPAWSPVGVTLLANLYRGRLQLQATYISEIVPPALVEQYLDLIISDLLA